MNQRLSRGLAASSAVLMLWPIASATPRTHIRLSALSCLNPVDFIVNDGLLQDFILNDYPRNIFVNFVSLIWINLVDLRTCQKCVKESKTRHRRRGASQAMLTRRQLLQAGAVAGAALGLPWAIREAYPFAQSPMGIRKFITDLPSLGPSGIPLATKSTTS